MYGATQKSAKNTAEGGADLLLHPRIDNHLHIDRKCDTVHLRRSLGVGPVLRCPDVEVLAPDSDAAFQDGVDLRAW